MPSDTPLAAAFGALADPVRLSVVRLLKDSPLRASEIADALALSRPAMSRHLRVLRRSGLVEERGLEEDARARVYRLRPERFSEIRGWLEEVESFWSAELAAFRQHVEKRPRRRRS